MNNRVPPSLPSTPSLFGSALSRPVTPSASPAPGGGWLDQSVPFTPKSNVTSLEIGNHQRCVPQIATPRTRTGFSPWISCHIVPHTPIKEETVLQESTKKTKSNSEIAEDLFGVVPTMEITATTATSTTVTMSSSASSSPLPPPQGYITPPSQRQGLEEKKVPIMKRCKRYLV